MFHLFIQWGERGWVDKELEPGQREGASNVTRVSGKSLK